MATKKKDGSGSIYKRGEIYWVKIYIDGKAHYESNGSTKLADAKRLRDRLLGQKHRGEITGGYPGVVTIGELLNDLKEYARTNIRESTQYIWGLVIERHLRPFFGDIKAQRLTTDNLKEYRRRRTSDGVTDATVNRELSVLRTALHNARKCTPSKVAVVPYFPMTPETNVRTGFMSDAQYDALLKELPAELKSLFVVGYETGIRLGELKGIQWDQVDFREGFISLETGETKNGDGRVVPILDGDMRSLLEANKRERDEHWPDSPWVFNRRGSPIKDFRYSWTEACKRAGVPDLKFHDLRRTAVRNMRRAGVPQVVRMKISGHRRTRWSGATTSWIPKT